MDTTSGDGPRLPSPPPPNISVMPVTPPPETRSPRSQDVPVLPGLPDGVVELLPERKSSQLLPPFPDSLAAPEGVDEDEGGGLGTIQFVREINGDWKGNSNLD